MAAFLVDGRRAGMRSGFRTAPLRVEHPTRVPHSATRRMHGDGARLVIGSIVSKSRFSQVFSAGRRKEHAGRVLHPDCSIRKSAAEI